MADTKRIEATLIPGDGIGPEIVDAVKSILQALGSPFQWDEQQAGLAAAQSAGDPLPAAPVFSNIGPVTGTIGIIPEFRELRELIVASPGYTEAIGDDLMITGVSAPQTIDADLASAANFASSRHRNPVESMKSKPARSTTTSPSTRRIASAAAW